MKRVCMVTGASRGIGHTTCEALRAAGHTVCAAMRKPSGTPGSYRLDVTDRASIERAVAEVVRDHGRIDVLISNAGFGLLGPVEAAQDAEMEEQFDVNVFGLVRVIQAVLPHMREARSGRIINISSIAGVYAMPFAGLYAATKHAVEAISESLALELDPWGIDVALVNPGYVRTGFLDMIALGSRELPGNSYAPGQKRISEMMQEGLKSGQDPADVAQVVLSVVEAKRSRYRSATTEAGADLLAQKLVDPEGNATLDRLRALFLSPQSA